MAEGRDGFVEGSGDGDAFGGGAQAGRVAPVGGEAGALLVEDAGEQGLGVADGVGADAALLGIDREDELAAARGPPSPGPTSLASKLKRSPTSAPARSSIMRAIDTPLQPPKGSCAPASAAAGSVVGLPSASIPHPSGIGSPSRWWIMISPRALALDAWSKTRGGRPPSRGHANDIGLVPQSGFVPPAGATYNIAATNAKPTSPRSARASVSGHRAAKMMRPSPEPRVSGFLDSIAGKGLGLSCVTVWEVLNGIGRLDPGPRRANLARRVQDLPDDFFEDRGLDWTASDAQECPRIMTDAVAGECLATPCFPRWKRQCQARPSYGWARNSG